MNIARRLLPTVALTAAAVSVVPAGAYQRPGTNERISVSSTGAQQNGAPPSWDAPAMTPDGRYVAFASRATNLVPGDTDNAPDVFLRDRRTGRTSLVSVAATGGPGHPTVRCGLQTDTTWSLGADTPAVSATGRYVAFTSCFDNLVSAGPGLAPPDTNLADDIFVRDMRTGKTTRVSVATGGGQSNGDSSQPSISADGRYVAFTSRAKNLDRSTCPNDTEQQVLCQGVAIGLLAGPGRVYVHDRRTGRTTVVSVSSGHQVADGDSWAPSISPDGRFVAFTSTADNLAADDTNRCVVGAALTRGSLPSCPDVFLHDLRTGKTTLVSVGIDGRAATSTSNGDNGEAGVAFSRQMISADDRYVAFRSDDDNLVPNAAGGGYGIYVYDRRTHRVARASVEATGTPTFIGAGSFAISANGRAVAFDTAWKPGCSNSPDVVDVHDVVTGGTESQDQDQDGRAGGCAPFHVTQGAALSADGRDVAFWDNAQNLVPGDTNGQYDVFVHDRGMPLSTGGLAGSGTLTMPGRHDFSVTGLAAATDAAGDVDATLTAQGANLIGASLVYRPRYRDLFVRLPVERMPLFAVADPLLVYGVDLTVDGVRYQVRAAKTGPLTASFGLFRRVGGTWTHVATLSGGYGTTGQEVVAALPLRDIGATHGARITRARAFTGLGSFATGPVRVVDTARFRAA